MTEQERQALLNSILGAQTGSPTMDVLSSALAGTSRTTQERLLESPLLVSTGTATPQQLTDAFSSWLNAKLADEIDTAVEQYNKDVAAIAKDVRAPQFVSNAANIIQSLPEKDVLDQLGLSNVLSNIFDGLATYDDFENALTTVTGEGQYAGMNLEAIMQTINPGYSTSALKSAAEQYAKDAANFQNERLQYETVDRPRAEAEIAALGAPPTAESLVSKTDQRAALNEFYKEMGLEGLSFLPAPWEQFQFSPEQALQLTGLTAGQFKPTRQELQQLKALEERAMGQETAARRIAAEQEAAARQPVPLSVMEQFREMQGRLDPLRRDVDAPGFGRTPPMTARPEQLAGRGSGRTTAASRRRAAGMEAIPSVADRPARLPSAAERAMQAMITARQNRPQQIAELLAAELAAKGESPFTRALAGQNIYGRYAG